jgi:hypothetical protein
MNPEAWGFNLPQRLSRVVHRPVVSPSPGNLSAIQYSGLHPSLCYDLNMKCSWQALVLQVWSPAGGAILVGGGNFRRWDLAGRNRPLGSCPWGLHVDPGPFLLPLSASSPPRCGQLTPPSPFTMMICSSQPRNSRANWGGTETSKTISQNKIFLPKEISRKFSKCLVIWQNPFK